MKKRLFSTLFPLLLSMVLSQPVLGHQSGAYNYGGPIETDNAAWMAALSNELKFSELSLPGTHDTMAIFFPVPFVDLWVRTQSMTLPQQMEAGIRVFDMRLELFNEPDRFEMYHGIAPLFAEIKTGDDFARVAEFGQDVLNPIKQFLQDHPTEVIFMEVASNQGSDQPSDFNKVFKAYMDNYPDLVWSPFRPDGTEDKNPILGDVRGKIVILQFFNGEDSNGHRWGLDGKPTNNPNMQISNKFGLISTEDVYDKWDNELSTQPASQFERDIKHHLEAADADGPGSDIIYLTHLSATVRDFPNCGDLLKVKDPIKLADWATCVLGGVAEFEFFHPAFVASGHVAPFENGSAREWTEKFESCVPLLGLGCGAPGDVVGKGYAPDWPRRNCELPGIDRTCIDYEGTNVLTMNYIDGGQVTNKVGIIMADFPGPDLIDAIIGINSPTVDNPILDPKPANEGSTVTASATFIDLGDDEPYSCTVDYGDGSGSQAGDVIVSDVNTCIGPEHVYADDDTYPVTVAVTDKNGATGTNSTSYTVLNVPPTVDAGADQTVNEGSLVSLPPATLTDPGAADTHTATIDWGDGTPLETWLVTEPPGGTNGTVAGSHVYADNGLYTVDVCVEDDDGGKGCDSFNVTVNNVAPTVNAGADQTANEGDSVGLAPTTFSDPGAADTHTATIDWGDGAPLEAGVLSEPSGGTGGTVAGSHVYADNGSYTVDVCVEDDDGGKGCDSLTLTVNNVAPTATFANTTPPDIFRGESATLVFTNVFDPGTADTFAYSYDCTNDGSFEQSGDTTTFDCTYPDFGTFNARGRIEDDDGGFTDYAVEIIVLSPQEAAQTIIDKIEEDLCDAGVLNKGQCNSLVVKLKHAKKRLGGAKSKAAINVLNAFINEIEGYMNGGILTSEQGQELIALANRVIASIG